ncbi:MAG: efflux RND transporter periplasmic adaptor subunit [Hyphomicrobiales bacterium]
MKRFKKIFWTLLIVVVVAVCVFLFFKMTSKKDNTQAFKTEKAQYRDISKKTIANGKIIPRREVEIKPQVSGIIDELFVEAGDKVKKGDLIAKIKIIPNMVNLNEASSRVNRASNSFENIKLMYERKKDLHAKGIIPTTDFEEIELQYLNAVEELKSAENNLQLIKEGQVKNSIQPTNTLVRSTIEGMILDVPVEKGKSVIESNTFNDGTTIAFVADMGEMIFEGNIDETDVAKVSLDMPIVLKIGALQGQEFNAILEHVSPKGVVVNGAVQFKIKAAVKLKDNVFIRSGYSSNAEFVLEKKKHVISVNENLLDFDEDDKPYLSILTKDGKTEKRNIKLGISDGIYTEVMDGIDTSTLIKKPFYK